VSAWVAVVYNVQVGCPMTSWVAGEVHSVEAIHPLRQKQYRESRHGEGDDFD
jgi:hypothetical protein